MRARSSRSLRLAWLTQLLLVIIFMASLACASPLADAARDLAHKIAASSGPGQFSLDIANRSSLDEKSQREVRSALESELQVNGVQTAKPEQAMGSIAVVLSESLHAYVWTAEISIGSDEKKVAMVSLPRPPTATPFAAAPPLVLKSTLLFAQEQPILDLALIEISGGSRLLVLDAAAISIYRQRGTSPSANWRWDLEASLPISHSRAFPRDLRGRLLLRRDHLFDVFLPGTFCRSSSNTVVQITLDCNASDDPWPLTPDDAGIRAFFASSRNFFTGALSAAIGKISTVPSFYSAAVLPRPNYTLWAFAAVDGSLHLVDGITDQLIRGAKWGSDLAAVHSGCGAGTQLVLSESGSPDRDSLRAFDVPDRDPVAASSLVDFNGRIVALWPESNSTGAIAIVKRRDTEWYEAYRVSVSCGN
jgi:hypothetical protein